MIKLGIPHYQKPFDRIRTQELIKKCTLDIGIKGASQFIMF